MKATKKQAEKVAKRYGATLEMIDYMDGAKAIEAAASDGFMWSEGVQFLLATYHTHFNETASDGYGAIIERMESNGATKDKAIILFTE